MRVCALILAVLTICCVAVEGSRLQKRTVADVLRLAQTSSSVLYHWNNVEAKETGCKCVNYNCGCCAHMEVEKIGLNDTGCVNVSYLPEQIGISLTFSIDGKVYINETISAKNPPPICFQVPGLKKYASLCLKFYNLTVTSHSLYGCAKIEARLIRLVVEDVNLGCFKLGNKTMSMTKLEPSTKVTNSNVDMVKLVPARKLDHSLKRMLDTNNIE